MSALQAAVPQFTPGRQIAGTNQKAQLGTRCAVTGWKVSNMAATARSSGGNAEITLPQCRLGYDHQPAYGKITLLSGLRETP